jgi:proteasome lid subunit RPN8/RPN11
MPLVVHSIAHENLKHHVWGRAFSPPVPAKAGTHWTQFELFSELTLEVLIYFELMVGKIIQNPVRPEIFISKHLIGELTGICVRALPNKAFGLVGGDDIYHPKSLYPCSTNLRNAPEWKPIFESFGDFYKDPDLGFVISPPEVKVVMEAINSRGESFIGVFHSHRFLSAEPTEIDLALSADPSLLSYIVSVANPSAPEIGIFRLNGGKHQSIPIVEY